MSGLRAVLRALHAPTCRLGKNARIVAVAIGWRMDAKVKVCAPLEALSKESHMSRSVTMDAITEACGPDGVFTRTKRGPGKANLYSVKTAGFVDVMTAGKSAVKKAKTAGKLAVKTAGFVDAGVGGMTAGIPYAKQIDTSPAAIRRIQSIEDRMRRVG